jgi:hypothetical protein
MYDIISSTKKKIASNLFCNLICLPRMIVDLARCMCRQIKGVDQTLQVSVIKEPVAGDIEEVDTEGRGWKGPQQSYDQVDGMYWNDPLSNPVTEL